MAKYWAIILIIFLLMLSCSSKETKVRNIEEISTLKWKCNTKELTNQPSGYLDLKSFNDSLIFITSFFGRQLIKFDRYTEKYSILGKQGNGPGEYRNPFSIIVNNDKLIINDMNSQRIQMFDFEGRFIKEYSFKKMVNATRMVMDNDSLIYLLNSGNLFDYFVINNNNESFIKVPKCFSSLKHPIVGSFGVFLFNDTLYAMNSYEWKVYKVDLITKKESVVDLKGVDNIFNWESYYDKNLTGSEESIIMQDKFIVRPKGIFNLVLNGKTNFLVTGSISNSDNYINLCYLFDINGNLLSKIEIKDLILFESSNGNLLFYEYDKDSYVINKIYCYKINQDIIF